MRLLKLEKKLFVKSIQILKVYCNICQLLYNILDLFQSVKFFFFQKGFFLGNQCIMVICFSVIFCCCCLFKFVAHSFLIDQSRKHVPSLYFLSIQYVDNYCKFILILNLSSVECNSIYLTIFSMCVSRTQPTVKQNINVPNPPCPHLYHRH